MFTRDMWNMYRRTRDELSRINNNVEGWHRGLYFNVNACHPKLSSYSHNGLSKAYNLLQK